MKCAVIAACGVAASAMAGVNSGSTSATLFGASYNVTTWQIAGDAGAGTVNFGAEGMTFHNGTLYVTHDQNNNRAAGRLVSYTPGASGNLSSPSTYQMGTGPSGLRWGPEGITVNTSGSGYGSFASGPVQIVGIDTEGSPDNFGVINTGAAAGSSPIDTRPVTQALDDIAWSSSLDRFAAVSETGVGDGSVMRFYNKTTMALEAASFALIDGAKGVTTVSRAFAELFTGQTVSTSEAFIVCSEFGQIAVYETSGLLVASAQSLSWLPATNSEPESIAADEANGLLFIGDEAGKAIYVVAVPAPAAASMLGVIGIFAGRRRR